MEEKKRDCKFCKDITCADEFNPDKIERAISAIVYIVYNWVIGSDNR